MLFEFFQQEWINGRINLNGISDSWDFRVRDWFERPEVSFLVSEIAGGRRFWLWSCRFCAIGHPAPDNLDLLRRKLLFTGRHFAGDDSLHDQAFIRPAADQRRTTITTLNHKPSQAKVELSFVLIFFAMAMKTVRFEYRANVRLEDGICERISRRSNRTDQQQANRQKLKRWSVHGRLANGNRAGLNCRIHHINYVG